MRSKQGILGLVYTGGEIRRPPLVGMQFLHEGAVRAGDPVTLELYDKPTVTILEIFRLFYNSDPDETDVLRVLDAPIAIRARRGYEERLETTRA